MDTAQHRITRSAPQGATPYDDGSLLSSFGGGNTPFGGGNMLDVAGLAQDQALASKLLERVHHKESAAPRIPVDVIEVHSGLQVRVDVAGVAKKDVGVSVDQHHLYVTVRRESEPGDPIYHLQERSAGSSSRCVKIGGKFSTSSCTAALDHGLLVVTFPRVGAEPERRTVPLT